MTLLDEAISGAEALTDEAANVATDLVLNVAGETAELFGDVVDSAIDVATDAAEEITEGVKRVGLRRLVALVLVGGALFAAWKLWQTLGNSEADTGGGGDVLDLSDERADADAAGMSSP